MPLELPDFPWDLLTPYGDEARAHPGGIVDLSVGSPVDPTPASVREALAARSPEVLYYACAAAGVDRAVYPALLAEIRLLNDGFPGDEGAAVWKRGDISPTSAARSFRALVKA